MHIPWTRRSFVKLLPGIGAWLSRGPVDAIGAKGDRQLESNALLGSATPRRGQNFSRLGYKMWDWDLQFMDIDPRTLKYADAERYADAAAEMGADSVLVYAITNTGLALFKSEFTPKFTNLPDDFLGAYLAACRKRNLKTELYYSLGWQKRLDVQHPEWAVLDANGKPVKEDETSQGFLGATSYLCFNSPFREYCLKQVKELADRFTFDLWDVDILMWMGRKLVCYNPYCLEKWRARTGQDLPRPLPQELYPQYLDFMVDTYRSIYQAVKDQLKGREREVPVTHNWGFNYDLDDFVMIESWPGGTDFYNMSVTAKLYRAHAHGREIQINPHRANNYVDYVNAPLPTIAWETAVAVSHNVGLMWADQAKLDGTIDEMAVRSGKEAFRVADQLIPKVRGTVPYAEVAILASERDQILTDDTASPDNPDFYGANRLLTDLHWPFDVITVEHLELAELAGYPLLVIPSLQYLAGEHRQVVLDYLEQGGHVFFCGRCAVLDHAGRPHAEPQLGLVKVRETHEPRGYVKPVFAMGDDRLKAANIGVVEVDPRHKVLGWLVPLSVTHQEGSPLQEVAYPLQGQTDMPVMVTGGKGQGQFTYVGYAFFQEYLKQDLPVMGEAFSKLVEEFYRPSVWVEAPMAVEAIYNQLGNELRISLVNGVTTRPAGEGAYTNIVEVIPIDGVTIRVRDKTIRRAYDLAGRELPVAAEGKTTVTTVPRLQQYDVATLIFK